jgi:hypothetical protein
MMRFVFQLTSVLDIVVVDGPFRKPKDDELFFAPNMCDWLILHRKKVDCLIFNDADHLSWFRSKNQTRIVI